MSFRTFEINCFARLRGGMNKDLSNPKVYAEVKSDPVHKMIKDCKYLTDVILKDNTDKALGKLLTPHLPSTPHYYSLWKTQ